MTSVHGCPSSSSGAAGSVTWQHRSQPQEMPSWRMVSRAVAGLGHRPPTRSGPDARLVVALLTGQVQLAPGGWRWSVQDLAVPAAAVDLVVRRGVGPHVFAVLAQA